MIAETRKLDQVNEAIDEVLAGPDAGAAGLRVLTLGSTMASPPRLQLYWLPLGAGGSPLVRFSGRCYEALVARREHRTPLRLYHAALSVELDGVRYVIEVAPAWDRKSAGRRAVAGGPVGSRLLGRSVLFRYEVRCWPDGIIPDQEYAVASPVELSTDPARAGCCCLVLPTCPRPCGDATSCARGRCGTPTRWSPGSSP